MADCCSQQYRLLIDRFFGTFNADLRDEKLLQHMDNCLLCREYFIEIQKEKEVLRNKSYYQRNKKAGFNLLFQQKTPLFKLLPIIILLGIALLLLPRFKQQKAPGSETPVTDISGGAKINIEEKKEH